MNSLINCRLNFRKLALLTLLCTGPAVLAYEAGELVFTKRADTALLAEPTPFAAANAQLELGTRLSITELRGNWLHASADSGVSGWIFGGNVSANAPDTASLLAQVPLDASATTATAAARPLSPAAADYGDRMDLAAAQEDLAWLLDEGAPVATAEVTAYLEQNGKGEFQ
jgi:hypothetical protein